MGIIVGLYFLAGLAISFVAMVVALILQRSLRKKGWGVSWGKYILATLFVTVALIGCVFLFSVLGAQDFDTVSLHVFLIGIAPGLGFISTYAYSLRQSIQQSDQR
jgi:hypothetical protein